MTDYEVEQRLGYTPCVCAKIDGTWHPRCYAGKTREQIAAGDDALEQQCIGYLRRKGLTSPPCPERTHDGEPTANDCRRTTPHRDLRPAGA